LLYPLFSSSHIHFVFVSQYHVAYVIFSPYISILFMVNPCEFLGLLLTSIFLMTFGRRCCICLSWDNVGEWLRQIPICKHVFHKNCIVKLFQTHSSYPLCRISLQNLHRPWMISRIIVVHKLVSIFIMLLSNLCVSMNHGSV
jgi:hypothetical protein